MADDFIYDVFLSHSSKDKPAVRKVAERLREDGLQVWFDEWELRPGDSIPAKIEAALEHSRVLVLCMSAHAFGSDWAQLEAGTFRFRDPLNKGRRFIPLRLDEAPIKGSLAQFLYINWLQEEQEREYVKLLEACRPPIRDALALPLVKNKPRPPSLKQDEVVLRSEGEKNTSTDHKLAVEEESSAAVFKGHTGHVGTVVVTPDGRWIISGSEDKSIRVWELETGLCKNIINAPSKVFAVVVDASGNRLITGSPDGWLRSWDIDSGRQSVTFERRVGGIGSLAIIPGPIETLASGQYDRAVGIWEVESGKFLKSCEGHMDRVYSVAASPDGHFVFSGSKDATIRVWSTSDWKCVAVLTGHFSTVRALAVSPDSRHLVSGSWDGTLRIWDLTTWQCLAEIQGHSNYVKALAITPDGKNIISGADDTTVRIWDLHSGKAVAILNGHKDYVYAVAVTPDGRFVVSGSFDTTIRIWPITTGKGDTHDLETTARYTNAKVLLVGESGVGKTGLSKRLALNNWQPSDSTVGAWATHWKLEVDSDDGIEREIWLWDFGGQADQRLIHQLYMDETALVVLVFDGQKEDLFETLGQWDRDLTRASRKAFTKLLVAGRVDAGGLRCSPSQVQAFAEERGYPGFLETSAKADTGCEDLKQAIMDGIRWENIPWRTSPRLFKRLKEEIIRLKDEGRVLMRFNQLRESLQLRMADETERFTDEQLKAVVGLLAGPGAVWELKFGSWVLLQPERINAYAQAVIHTLREDQFERGCIPEEKVLAGHLKYQSSILRLPEDEERIVLLAMHQALVEWALCLREHTETGTQLIFPSYYRRERKELAGHPAVQVSYRFHGFLDDIYATLVVRLHHSRTIENDELWRYAADFRTLTGKQLGLKLTRLGEGAGELEVYFDPTIPVEEKILFSKYVHEHVMQKGQEVVRLRHYVCPHCGTEAHNREIAMKRLAKWQDSGGEDPTMLCVDCEQRFSLWDKMEQYFASPEAQQQVRELQERSEIILDNESKERALVGEVISTVALAGQICREFSVSDHGLDMEIEFKNDTGEATGRKLYLQLKSGDSYLRERKRDGSEVFKIAKTRHAQYWREQAFPILLVIRNSEGEVRWMDIRNYLKGQSVDGKKAIKQIVFDGERFDVMSVRRWREKALDRRL